MREIPKFEAYGRTWEGLIAPDSPGWGTGDEEGSWGYWCLRYQDEFDPQSRLAAADAACWWQLKAEEFTIEAETQSGEDEAHACNNQWYKWSDLYKAALRADLMNGEKAREL